MYSLTGVNAPRFAKFILGRGRRKVAVPVLALLTATGSCAASPPASFTATMTGTSEAKISGSDRGVPFSSTDSRQPMTVVSPSALSSSSTPFGGSRSGGAYGYGYGASFDAIPTISSGLSTPSFINVRLTAFSVVGVNNPPGGASVAAKVTSAVDILLHSPSANSVFANSYKVGIDPSLDASTLANGDVRITDTLIASASTSSASQLGTGTLIKRDVVSIWPTGISESILKGSVKAAPNSSDKAVFELSFSPVNGMSLGTAAQTLGFNHFNVIQTITHIPPGWRLGLYDSQGNRAWSADVTAKGDVSGFVNDVTGVRRPGYDPIDSTTLRYGYTHPGFSNVGYVNVDGGAADNAPFVMGEDPSFATLSGNLLFTGAGALSPMTLNKPNQAPVPEPLAMANTLNFRDRVSLAAIDEERKLLQVPSGDLRPYGVYFGLRTDLVGVTDSGEVVHLPDGLGVHVSWNTDNANVDDVVQFWNPAYTGGSPSAYGGVFDAALDISPVDEPSVIALLSVGLLFLGQRVRKGLGQEKERKPIGLPRP